MSEETKPVSAETKPTDTQNDSVNNETPKSFTQDQVNEIVQKRVAQEKKGMPTKEEFAEYKAWKEAQKTEEEKRAEKEKENAKVLAERNNYKMENLVLKKGVKAEDADYVIFKVSKQEGDFAENLNDFLKNNPKYLATNEVKTTTQQSGVTVSTGADHTKVVAKDDQLRKAFGLK